MSAYKFLSVVPWWPLLGLIILGVAGGMTLTGLDMITQNLGVQVSGNMKLLSQSAVIVVILVDMIFAYSVCSNKLRIHNIHCAAEDCRGYRIKDGAGCCAKILRCVCKAYNVFLAFLSWAALMAIMAVTILLVWFSGVTLFVVGLCQISQPAIDTLLNRTLELEADTTRGSPIEDFVKINPGTNSTMVCAEGSAISTGSYYVLVAGPLMLLGQFIMKLSFQTVASVSWRHLKDTNAGRLEERSEKNAQQCPSQLSHVQMANGGSYGCGPPGCGMGAAYGAGGYPGVACPYGAGPGCGMPPGGGYGGPGGGGYSPGGGPGINGGGGSGRMEAGYSGSLAGSPPPVIGGGGGPVPAYMHQGSSYSNNL